MQPNPTLMNHLTVCLVLLVLSIERVLVVTKGNACKKCHQVLCQEVQYCKTGELFWHLSLLHCVIFGAKVMLTFSHFKIKCGHRMKWDAHNKVVNVKHIVESKTFDMCECKDPPEENSPLFFRKSCRRRRHCHGACLTRERNEFSPVQIGPCAGKDAGTCWTWGPRPYTQTSKWFDLI